MGILGLLTYCTWERESFLKVIISKMKAKGVESDKTKKANVLLGEATTCVKSRR